MNDDNNVNKKVIQRLHELQILAMKLRVEGT